MGFSEKLKEIRLEKKLTQAQLAELLSVSRQAVSKWESNGGYPETETLLLLATKLNISLDYLFFDAKDKELRKRPQITASSCPFLCPHATITGKDPVIVLKAVAQYLGVSEYDITSKNRTEEIIYARRLIMYICRTYLNTSYAEIGELLGKRDHVTILHGISKTQELLETKPEVQQSINSILAELHIKL